MTVELEHPGPGRDGALINRGTINSGFALYVHRDRLHFDYNCFHEHTRVVADNALGAGPHTIQVEVVRGAEQQGEVRITVDGNGVVRGRVPRLVGMLSSTGMDIGRALAPINDDYRPPFAYPGRIAKVTFELPVRRNERDRREEAEREARAAMARQ